MTKKETSQVPIRMSVDKDNHSRIKRIRRALEYKKGGDSTLIETYSKVLEMGIESMETQLNIQPLKEIA